MGRRAQTPGGHLIFDQRMSGLSVRRTNGTVSALSADFSDLFASGETGLMGLVLDPSFAGNRRFYTCQAHRDAAGEASKLKTRLMWNYGHRNPQGLALRANGQMFNVEHGPGIEDEVNLSLIGRNYGWNPVGVPTPPAPTHLHRKREADQ